MPWFLKSHRVNAPTQHFPQPPLRKDILLVKHGLTNAFTEKSEHPSHAHLEISHQNILAAKHGITQRIHCRYSIRTDQYLARLDILLVKHGLTNAFTEKSEHPSHAHLEISHQDILAAKHGITQRIHCRYSIRTDQYLARLDILLVKHGLTNAFTEKSEHPSHAHLEISHQDILAAKHGEPISTWRVWIFCWSCMDSPTHSQRNPNTLHMPISKSLTGIF